MTNWTPISTLPEMPNRGGMGYAESRPLIVWISDKSFRGFVKGRCVLPPGGGSADAMFTADGFNGSWNITHWSEVTAPEPTP